MQPIFNIFNKPNENRAAQNESIGLKSSNFMFALCSLWLWTKLGSSCLSTQCDLLIYFMFCMGEVLKLLTVMCGQICSSILWFNWSIIQLSHSQGKAIELIRSGQRIWRCPIFFFLLPSLITHHPSLLLVLESIINHFIALPDVRS